MEAAVLSRTINLKEPQPCVTKSLRNQKAKRDLKKTRDEIEKYLEEITRLQITITRQEKKLLACFKKEEQLIKRLNTR